MIRDLPLHNFLFQTDPDGFYNGLHCFCTPWIDVCVLLHLIRRYRPKRFLEVGTHRGFTTRILSEKFPVMSIVTVDPGDQIPRELRPENQVGEYLPASQVGELVRDRANVEVIPRPFRDVDWNHSQFDMVFIDGNHSYSEVLADSHLAMKLVKHPGIIAWHDFNNVADVNRALGQLALNGPIVSLHNTWMAYWSTFEG